MLRGGLPEEGRGDEAPIAATTVYGDFEIARRDDGSLWELGRGAMGVTYRATDRVLHRPVALKVIQLGGASSGAGQRSDALPERFLREARSAAALRHANVAGVFQFGSSVEAGSCYYAMELVEGETLEARVRRDGPLDVDTALEIVRQVTMALVAAASRSLIHRDLKPGNLMLTGSGDSPTGLEVKVIDFGLAKATASLGERDLTHGGFVGTPAFASPEQLARQPVDARSDLYSLGITLWYALTGHVPFTGRNMEELGRDPARSQLPVEQLSARGVPTCVVALLRRVLAPNPAKRPASAREFLAALEACHRQLRTATSRHHLRVAAVLTLAAAAGAWWIYAQATGHPATSAPAVAPAPAIPDKSIAVLPFENLSDDKANGHFTDGVQDEILADLAKVADLKVIARSSVIQYKSDAPRNLPEIAAQLGVANVLEGSVQRVGNQVRVTANLINARTAAHLWAEHYDRPLNDVFAIQSEIAEAIAGQLKARLSPAEKTTIEAPPTADLAAYDLYLRALQIDRTFTRSEFRKALPEGVRLLEEAVGRDPKFLVAWTLLAHFQGELYWWVDRSPAQLERFHDAVQAAVRLAPDAGETHSALADFYYHGYLDYARALTELDLARRTLPNDSGIYALSGYVKRREGRWAEALHDLELALELDPRNIPLLQQNALGYMDMGSIDGGRYADAERTFRRILAIIPEDASTRLDLACLEIDARADLKPFETTMTALLAENPHFFHVPDDQFYGVCERDPATAERYLANVPPEGVTLWAAVWPRAYREALVARLQGDESRAHAAFTAARVLVEKQVAADPELAMARSVLGLIDAGLGRKEEAIAEGRQARAMLPISKDALTGQYLARNLAQILAWTGEKTAAIEQIEAIERLPNQLSYGLLKLDPAWDNLRGDPRFEALVTSLAPKPGP